MLREQIEKGLAKYIPSAVVPLLAGWVIDFNAHLRVTKARNSKLGDYRHPFGDDGHRITINHNLNPYFCPASCLTVQCYPYEKEISPINYVSHFTVAGCIWPLVFAPPMAGCFI